MDKNNRGIDCLLIQSPFSAQGILPHSDAHTIGEGLLSVSSHLESKAFSTEVFCVDELYLDLPGFNFTRKKHEIPLEEVKEVIKSLSPRTVGVSALTPQYPVALEVLRLCKEADPCIVTFMGGPHATYVDAKVFEHSEHVDIVVRGEGEWTAEELLGRIKADKPYDDVLGITFRKDGKVVRNDDRPFGDLETLPPVNYRKVNPEYLKRCSFFLTTTRGCPFNCSYCVEGKYWGSCVRARSLEAVVEEVKFVAGNYPGCQLFFLGSVFNAPEQFFTKFCKELEKIDIGRNNVGVLVGAAYLPESHLRCMKDAGIDEILIAVESASPVVLKRMNKRISFDLVAEKCRLIRKYGFRIGTFWILGHPGETEETARESLDAMVYLWENDLNDKQEVAIFTPYPGLPILNDPKKEGFRIIDPDFSNFSRFDKPVIELDDLSHERLSQLHREAREIAQFWMSCKNRIFSEDLDETFKNIASVK